VALDTTSVNSCSHGNHARSQSSLLGFKLVGFRDKLLGLFDEP
jgi:hypothetical protein